MNSSENFSKTDKEIFLLHFAAKGIPESVVNKVYQFLRKEIAIPNKVFLCFSDNIYLKYGIVDEDLEALAEALAALLNRRLPPPTMKKNDKPIVDTIEDLILFVWSCSSSD